MPSGINGTGPDADPPEANRTSSYCCLAALSVSYCCLAALADAEALLDGLLVLVGAGLLLVVGMGDALPVLLVPP